MPKQKKLLKEILHQIGNMNPLSDDQMKDIENFSSEDKSEIIQQFNKMATSVSDIIMNTM